uniref:Uncharacterized protein n=1 Tax=Daphnia galeata TaxID=27404 RepID=A0A8J2RMI3_9CRUS|nr:unnamed protein product [Daphnia galeata]
MGTCHCEGSSEPASTSTPPVQRTELMGTHIELDSSREDSSILSSSSLRRESDTRDSEDNNVRHPLKLPLHCN